MPSITRLEHSFAAAYKLDEYIKEKKADIPEPMLSILTLIAEHKATRKDNESIKFIGQYTAINDRDDDGYYKHDVYQVSAGGKWYNVKIDIDFSGGDKIRIIARAYTINKIII